MSRIYTPQNKKMLHLFWYLIDNAGEALPLEDLWEVCRHPQQKVILLRHILESNGYTLEAVRGYGYRVRKVGA